MGRPLDSAGVPQSFPMQTRHFVVRTKVFGLRRGRCWRCMGQEVGGAALVLRASPRRCASVAHGGTPTQPTHNINGTSSSTSVHKSCGVGVCRPLCGVVGLGPFSGTCGSEPLHGVEVAGPSAPLCGVVGLGCILALQSARYFAVMRRSAATTKSKYTCLKLLKCNA